MIIFSLLFLPLSHLKFPNSINFTYKCASYSPSAKFLLLKEAFIKLLFHTPIKNPYELGQYSIISFLFFK